MRKIFMMVSKWDGEIQDGYYKKEPRETETHYALPWHISEKEYNNTIFLD